MNSYRRENKNLDALIPSDLRTKRKIDPKNVIEINSRPKSKLRDVEYEEDEDKEQIRCKPASKYEKMLAAMKQDVQSQAQCLLRAISLTLMADSKRKEAFPRMIADEFTILLHCVVVECMEKHYGTVANKCSNQININFNSRKMKPFHNLIESFCSKCKENGTSDAIKASTEEFTKLLQLISHEVSIALSRSIKYKLMSKENEV